MCYVFECLSEGGFHPAADSGEGAWHRLFGTITIFFG